MTTATIPDDATSITGRRTGSVVEQLLAPADQRVVQIELGRLHANPDNPRESVGDIIELADSIRSVGILEPLIVASASAFQASDDRLPMLTADDFVVIAGHRRLAGADLAAIATVPCLVRDDLIGADADVAMLVENVHRADLTPLEEARSFKRLQDTHGKTQRDIAKLVGCNQSHVSKRLALLDLPESMQAEVAAEGITIEAALAISKHAGNDTVINAIINRPEWQSIDEAAEDAVRKEERAKALVDAKAKIKASGVSKIVSYDHWTLTQSHGVPRALSFLAADGVNVDEHIHHDCHAVAVGYDNSYGSELHTVPVCTNPKNHPESADNKRNEQRSREDAKRERERKLGEKRRDARLEAIRTAVTSASKISADTEHAVHLIVLHDLFEQAFDEAEYVALASILNIAVEPAIVGIDGEVDPGDLFDNSEKNYDAVMAYVAKGPAEAKRTLMAAVLIDAEQIADRGYGIAGSQKAILEWLPKHGYKLSGTESSRLKALSK